MDRSGVAIRRLALIPLLFLGGSLGGCKASKYKQAAEDTRAKNPHAAIEYLARCLGEVNREDKQAIDKLDEIGKTIAIEHAAKVETLEKAGKYDEAVAQCDRVLATRDFIHALPGGVRISHDDGERPRFAQKAATKFYDEGAKLEAADKKKAAIAFRRSTGFIPSYKDAQARYDKNRALASMKVAIMPFQAASAEGKQLEATATDKFMKSIVEKKPEFLELVSGSDGASARCQLNGKITCTYKDTGWQRKPMSNTEKRTVQTGTDSSGQPINEEKTYQATWTVNTRSTSFSFALSYDVKDVTANATKWAGTSTISAKDEKEHVSNVEGDTEAVPLAVSLASTDEVEPKTWDTYIEAIDKPIDELTSKLYQQAK